MSRRLLEIVILALLGWLAITLAPSESLAQAPYEPNDAATEAAGPLLTGQSYTATLESIADKDFFFLYVAAAADTKVVLSVENFGGASATSQIDARIVDSAGTFIGGALYVIKGERRTTTVALAPGKYFVEVAANEVNEGQASSYRLTPEGEEGAFVPYSSIEARCGSATASVTAREAAVKRAKTRLLRAIGRVRRARFGTREAREAARELYTRAKKRLAARKRALRTARRTQSPWCFIPR
jgi:hypothetical protein